MDSAFALDFSRTDDGLLCARVGGVRSVASTIAYWEGILAEVTRERPAGLIVLDELVGEELAASEWKKLVVHMAGRGLEGVPIAHVKAFAFDQISYCERYANEAGLQARAFRRESEARDWLRARPG